MSDVMLYGILRMPYELAMNDEVSRFQFYQNAQRAADRIEELEKIIREGIRAFGAIQEKQLKDKFETRQTNPVNWVYDNGKWSAKVDKKVFVESDDFTHDVRLYVDGDFEDDLQKLAYAKEIAKRLNVTPQTIWCDCGDSITKDSGAKCGVCVRETK